MMIMIDEGREGRGGVGENDDIDKQERGET